MALQKRLNYFHRLFLDKFSFFSSLDVHMSVRNKIIFLVDGILNFLHFCVFKSVSVQGRG